MLNQNVLCRESLETVIAIELGDRVLGAFRSQMHLQVEPGVVPPTTLLAEVHSAHGCCIIIRVAVNHVLVQIELRAVNHLTPAAGEEPLRAFPAVQLMPFEHVRILDEFTTLGAEEFRVWGDDLAVVGLRLHGV